MKGYCWSQSRAWQLDKAADTIYTDVSLRRLEEPLAAVRLQTDLSDLDHPHLQAELREQKGC